MRSVFVGQVRTAGDTRVGDRGALRAARLGLALAFLALISTSAGANGDGGRILAPRAGAVVRAGDLVGVEWTPVLADVEEFEILLSIDGGRTFPLRLTVSMDPRLTSYAWRVPNLPSGAACLRLRVGDGEREETLSPGPTFQLVGNPAAPTGKITFQGGEWWTTEGVAAAPRNVGVEPWWSDQGPRGDGSLAAAAFPPPRPDLGTPQGPAALDDGNVASHRPRPWAPPREDRAAASFPKRE